MIRVQSHVGAHRQLLLRQRHDGQGAPPGLGPELGHERPARLTGGVHEHQGRAQDGAGLDGQVHGNRLEAAVGHSWLEPGERGAVEPDGHDDRGAQAQHPAGRLQLGAHVQQGLGPSGLLHHGVLEERLGADPSLERRLPRAAIGGPEGPAHATAERQLGIGQCPDQGKILGHAPQPLGR